MPKFDKSENELQTNLDKWLFYIKNLKDLQMIPQVFQGNEVFEQAFKTAQIANMNCEEWQNYEYSLKTYRDNLATILSKF
nr:PD-(D/E)XK nuclease family transposase [Moraxella boevrei]